MPHYRIEIIPAADDRLGGASVMEQEERRFANLGQALQRAREMYERHKIRAKGFRIFNAVGELLHLWVQETAEARAALEKARKRR